MMASLARVIARVVRVLKPVNRANGADVTHRSHNPKPATAKTTIAMALQIMTPLAPSVWSATKANVVRAAAMANVPQVCSASMMFATATPAPKSTAPMIRSV